MKLYPYILIALLSLLTSCNNAPLIEIDHNNAIRISIPADIPKIAFNKYSDVYDDIKLVKLETSKECLIGRIDKLVAHKGHFFILDQVQSKAVFEFDSNGKFIKRFGSNGRGRGKFNTPNDLSVYGNELVIWDNEVGKFLVYDIGDGRLLRELKAKSTGKSGVILDKDHFAIYMDLGNNESPTEKANLKILNNEAKLIGSGFEHRNNEYSKGEMFFYPGVNHMLLSPGYSNDIYALENNKAIKKYIIDFGKYALPSDFANDFQTSIDFSEGLKKSNYAYLSKYFETPDHLIFSFVFNSQYYDCFYSKKIKKLKIGNVWINNVKGIVPGAITTVSNGTVISFFEPSSGIDYFKKNFTHPMSKEKVNSFIKILQAKFSTKG